jgi:para-nitrobenzyl esterase
VFALPFEVMHRRLALCLAAAALPLLSAIPQPVRTDKGLVSGTPGSDPEVIAFKGIPFAAPPVGDSRWRAPESAAPWTGVKKADQFSRSCIQKISQEHKPWTYEFLAHNEVSEDCLYLNVWTGAKTANDKRAVFVWVYGGGFSEGSTAVPAYDGEKLAERGVVVVTMNYRLGVFGFLAHPELSKESRHGASGNYGLLDQIAALAWVQKNIAAFGGDPERVTLGGQSAGAASVHDLIASGPAKGLFQRAMAESGSSVASSPFASLHEAEEQGVNFAASRGAHSLKELRALPWRDLLPNGAKGPAFPFHPIADGWVLTASGKQNDVPILTGWTADEASSQADYGKVTAEQWPERAQKRFGDRANAFLQLYPVASQKAAARDQNLASMYLWAAERAKTAKTKAFTYYWTHTLPGPDSARYGAFHSSEVPYVFDSLNKADRPWTAEDHKIAGTLDSYWVNFINNGDPNGKGLAHWPAFAEQNPLTMELGNKFAQRPVAEKAKLAFFQQYFSAR